MQLVAAFDVCLPFRPQHHFAPSHIPHKLKTSRIPCVLSDLNLLLHCRTLSPPDRLFDLTKGTSVHAFALMAGFMSVISAQRYCQSNDCRNGIRLNVQDKLCERCAAASDPGTGVDSSKPAVEDGHPLPQPPRPSIDERVGHSPREDYDWKPVLQAFSPAPVETQTDPFAAHLAMLDERQQNRARKLERETEEVDGRWRTRHSSTALMGSSPPHRSRSRRSNTDGAVVVDAYRPNGRYRPHEIDAYRPGRSSPSRGLRSTDASRLHETTPLRSSGTEAQQTTGYLALRPANKRKFESETAGDGASNKSLLKPSESARCGKRKCNNIALSGKDRCESCYRAEGRHPGVSTTVCRWLMARIVYNTPWSMIKNPDGC